MIRNCRGCRAKRSPNQEMPLKMHRDDILFVNSHFALDPITLEGQKHYLILVERHSGYPSVYPMKDCTLPSIIRALTHHFFQFSCRPISLRTDAGKQFSSSAWDDFCHPATLMTSAKAMVPTNRNRVLDTSVTRQSGGRRNAIRNRGRVDPVHP